MFTTKYKAKCSAAALAGWLIGAVVFTWLSMEPGSDVFWPIAVAFWVQFAAVSFARKMGGAA